MKLWSGAFTSCQELSRQPHLKPCTSIDAIGSLRLPSPCTPVPTEAAGFPMSVNVRTTAIRIQANAGLWHNSRDQKSHWTLPGPHLTGISLQHILCGIQYRFSEHPIRAVPVPGGTCRRGVSRFVFGPNHKRRLVVTLWIYQRLFFSFFREARD